MSLRAVIVDDSPLFQSVLVNILANANPWPEDQLQLRSARVGAFCGFQKSGSDLYAKNQA
jgi:hypothetical protein